jgi:hypothetical protein
MAMTERAILPLRMRAWICEVPLRASLQSISQTRDRNRNHRSPRSAIARICACVCTSYKMRIRTHEDLLRENAIKLLQNRTLDNHHHALPHRHPATIRIDDDVSGDRTNMLAR